MTFPIRAMEERDLASAAALWESGWHDAHDGLVPPELVRLRSSQSFRDRMSKRIGTTRVSVAGGKVLGFHMVEDDELYQLYVATEARGTGLALALIRDAERELSQAGHSRAWLACTVGNNRAARFYEKAGWQNTGLHTVELETLAAPFPLQVWRFEKQLG